MSIGRLYRLIKQETRYEAVVKRAQRVSERIYDIYDVDLFVDEQAFQAAWTRAHHAFIAYIEDTSDENLVPASFIHIKISSLCFHIISAKCVRLDPNYIHATNDNNNYRSANFDNMYFLHLNYTSEIFVIHLWNDIFVDIVSRALGNKIIPSFVSEKNCDDIESLCRAIRLDPAYILDISKNTGILKYILQIYT